MNILSRCPITFTATINGGGRVKSQAQQPQKPAICRFRRFAVGQKFTKSLLFCSRPFLQQCVHFCGKIYIKNIRRIYQKMPRRVMLK